MAGEANTTQKQNEMLRAMKQRHGRGKGFKDTDEDLKQLRMPRVVNAQFAGKPLAMIEEHFNENPVVPMTTSLL